MVALALLVLCVPLAAGLTIALLPVWSWLEARFGIESVGHSGPADWCYGVVYAGCVIVIASGPLWSRRRARQPFAADWPSGRWRSALADRSGVYSGGGP
jgi:hypothetical protein